MVTTEVDVTVLHMASHRKAHAADAPGEAAMPSPAPQTLADPVLRAAYKSIMDVGLRRTTMAGVARQAGISRMTLYRRYADLDRLLAALLETELVAVLTHRRAQVDPALCAASRLTQLASATTADVVSHPLIDRVLSLDPQELLPLIVDRFGSTQQLVHDQLVEMITAGQDPSGDGSIRAGCARDLALAILIVTQAFVFSHRAIETLDHDRAWVGELNRLIAGYVDPGMGSPCGTERINP